MNITKRFFLSLACGLVLCWGCESSSVEEPLPSNDVQQDAETSITPDVPPVEDSTEVSTTDTTTPEDTQDTADTQPEDVMVVEPPVADAGADQLVYNGSDVVLSGANSSDPQDLPLTYAWTLISAPAGSTARVLEETSVETRLVPDLVGTYEISLIVNNGTHSSTPDTVVVRAVRDDVQNGVFNPAEVYLLGTLSEGACYLDAMAHWSEPNIASVGFDCYVDERNMIIAPDTGRPLYTNTFEDILREYHCDGCPTWTPQDSYPDNVLDNDPVLPTPPCSDRISSFLINHAGDRIHGCGVDYYDASGNPLVDLNVLSNQGYYPIAYTGRLVLIQRVPPSILDLDTGTETRVTGLPPNGEIKATRTAGPTAFRVVYEDDTLSDPLDPAAALSLWTIDASGQATHEGTYPGLPADHSGLYWHMKLDGVGAMYMFGRAPGGDDVIIRSPLNGSESEVIYSEASNPEVKVHISGLVTGP